MEYFKKVFKWVLNIPEWPWIRKFTSWWTLLSILFFIAASFNLIPFYEFKIVKKTRIEPRISLFPGSEIRLRPVFYSLQEDKIINIEWHFTGNNQNLYITGLQPSIKLPEVGGLYNLSVNVDFEDGRNTEARIPITITQDKPEKAKAVDNIKVSLKDFLLPRVQFVSQTDKAPVIEVYSGDNTWIEVAKYREGQLDFEIPTGVNITLFNKNEVLYRVKGKYGPSVPLGTTAVHDIEKSVKFISSPSSSALPPPNSITPLP